MKSFAFAMLLSQSEKRKLFFMMSFCLLIFFSMLASLRHSSLLPGRYSHLRSDHISGAGTTPRRRQVAIASDFLQHFDVHLAVARTVHEVLGLGGDIRVFSKTPLRHGFQDVVDTLGLYDGDIESPDDFIHAITSNDIYSKPGDMIDLVIFGTCEVDMRRWSDELLAVWDARPADKKFEIVCIVHHFRDTAWQGHITPWASRGVIRLLPIANHVGRTFRAHFQELADSTDPQLYQALYEYIDIDVHVPVLDLPEYGQRRDPIKLGRAVIQGNFQSDRRDYGRIFQDLIASLRSDAVAWGYSPRSNTGEPYDPIKDAHPFTLHLIGDGELEIPKELANMVILHRGLSYIDFYALMQSMDVVLPAFVNHDYYDNQASSTVAMAVQCNVPNLATNRMRKAYGYIDDDRVTITHPQAIREIDALHLLRSGNLESYNASTSVSFPEVFAQDLRLMVQKGWRRSRRGFDTFKRELWESNREAMWRILNDLPGEI